MADATGGPDRTDRRPPFGRCLLYAAVVGPVAGLLAGGSVYYKLAADAVARGRAGGEEYLAGQRSWLWVGPLVGLATSPAVGFILWRYFVPRPAPPQKPP